MVFGLLIIAIQVALVVDVIRNGRPRIWIMALMFLPLASTIAYLIIEILPRFQHNRYVRTAKAEIVRKLDPERELRAARDQLDIADTHANRLRLADALTDLGRYAEALPLYQRVAGPGADRRTNEKLARALYLSDRPAEALTILEGMAPATGQSERDRLDLLRARVLEDIGRLDEALPIYADVSTRLPGDEARCRHAGLLLKMGRPRDARMVLQEVQHRMKRLDRHARAQDADMYDWVERELSGLRV